MGEEERRIGLGEDTMTEGEEEEMRSKFLKRRESRWVVWRVHIYPIALCEKRSLNLFNLNCPTRRVSD